MAYKKSPRSIAARAFQSGKPHHKMLAATLVDVVVIRSGAELPLEQRLLLVGDEIERLLDLHQPHAVAIERVFVHRNPDSALKLGQARGAAICAAVGLGANAHEYAPRAIKLAVSGYGAAEKAQVAQMVTALLHLERRPTADAADALAVALCHAQTRRLAALTSLAAAPRTMVRRGGRSGTRPVVRP